MPALNNIDMSYINQSDRLQCFHDKRYASGILPCNCSDINQGFKNSLQLIYNIEDSRRFSSSLCRYEGNDI